MTLRTLAACLIMVLVASAQTALQRFARAEAAGDVAGMRREADAATLESPSDPESWRALARTLEAQALGDIKRGRFAFVSALRLDACEAFAKAATLTVSPIADLFASAKAALLAGDASRGLAVLAPCLEKPTSEIAVLGAKLELLKGDGAAALRLLVRVPSDSSTWGTLSEVAVLLGDRDLAASAMVRACQLGDGETISAVFGPLTRSWRDGGDPGWRSLIDRVAKEVSTSPFIAWYQGDAAYRETRAADAIVGFTKYSTAFPNDPLAWQCLALALPLERRFAEAQEALDKAIDLGTPPEAALDARRRMATAAYGAKDYTLACAILTVIVGESDDPTDWLNLGVLHLDVRNINKARAAYEHVAQDVGATASIRGKAMNFLALLLDGEGDKAGSEALLRASIELSDDTDARENLANLLVDTKRYAEAIPLLERLVRDDPARIRSIYHLARARHPQLILPAGN